MSEFLTRSVKSAVLTDIFGNKMFFDKVDNFKISFDPDDTNEITFEGTCMRIEEPDKDLMEGLAKKEEVLEIPNAEIAYEKTKAARKENALKKIDEEWEYLTNLICDRIKNGVFSVTIQILLCDENVERLRNLGYIVFKQDNAYCKQTKISWF